MVSSAEEETVKFVIHDSMTDLWVFPEVIRVGPQGPGNVYLQVRNGVTSWLVFFLHFWIFKNFLVFPLDLHPLFSKFFPNNVLASSSPRFSAPETVQNTQKIPPYTPHAGSTHRDKKRRRTFAMIRRFFGKKTCFWWWKGAGSRKKQGPGNKTWNVLLNPQKHNTVQKSYDLNSKLRVARGSRLTLTWIKHQHISASHRNLKPPSGKTITTDRCLTHIRDAAHSDSNVFVSLLCRHLTHTTRIRVWGIPWPSVLFVCSLLWQSCRRPGSTGNLSIEVLFYKKKMQLSSRWTVSVKIDQILIWSSVWGAGGRVYVTDKIVCTSCKNLCLTGMNFPTESYVADKMIFWNDLRNPDESPGSVYCWINTVVDAFFWNFDYLQWNSG